MADNPADLLRAMADRIERNDPEDFAGCMVIVPPETNDGYGGDAVEILLIDPARDIANFWSTVTAKVRIENDKFVSAQNVPPLGSYNR